MKIIVFIMGLFAFQLLADKKDDLITLIKENESNPYALCNRGGIWGLGKKTFRSSSGAICSDKVVAAFSLYLCVNAPKEKKVEGFYFPERPIKKQSDCFRNAVEVLKIDNLTAAYLLKKSNLLDKLNDSLLHSTDVKIDIKKALCSFVKKSSPNDYKELPTCWIVE